MNLKPEELEENGYVLLDRMNHQDIKPFVKIFLNKRTWFSFFYYSMLVVCLFVLLFICIRLHHLYNYPFNKMLGQVFFGILLFLALIPVHEFIHVLAYKLVGAKQTSYDVNLKKFYFLAIADKFVTSESEFKIVALAPFLVITGVLLAIPFLSGDLWKVSIFTALLTHSIGCSGDFALLSYFEFNKEKQVVTYDDKENNVSFFYGREK